MSLGFFFSFDNFYLSTDKCLCDLWGNPMNPPTQSSLSNLLGLLNHPITTVPSIEEFLYIEELITNLIEEILSPWELFD